ncbi:MULTISPECIES: YdbC family protein [Bacillaceae]|uniref:Seryl-tRNA synthetase n=1 Tax=Oceanobacillus caeni TaxID=405946 RepID=A0ABR5MPC6_9BACI|nr:MULTISPECIES: PC4/YdbC family ssDNA-binding protein [Bacillaceae]KPH79274.1 seryl-tRNA synthetase [Oceanobacillus caeni]MED4475673.1 PC4/YdbC family ssDNA-binding protein [Oceanobacillus caeni]
MAEIKYDIIETIAVISESPKGWTKELNLISWNGREPKYDLRDWAPNKEKMGKGITLTKDELLNLKATLVEWE